MIGLEAPGVRSSPSPHSEGSLGRPEGHGGLLRVLVEQSDVDVPQDQREVQPEEEPEEQTG